MQRIQRVFQRLQITTRFINTGTGTQNKGSQRMAQARRNVLCFGDSLTQGYYLGGSVMGYKTHPYSSVLGKLLGSTVTVQAEGIPGESAVGEMAPRLERLLKAAKVTYDVVVLLGGSNDLGSEEPAAIFGAVRDLHLLCHKHGAQTVAVTLPELTGFIDDVAMDQSRCLVNEMIIGWAAKNPEKVSVADLARQLPQAALSIEERMRLWDDGIHLTPAGYDRMGEIIHPAVQSALDHIPKSNPLEISGISGRVLCFGDSLTHGYSKGGRINHPYSNTLTQLLGPKCYVETSGIAGESAVWSMGERLATEMKEEPLPYDVVVILGGTNDLGGEEPENIFEALKEMHSYCHSRGSRTVAVTLPELDNIPWLDVRELNDTRTSVNKMLVDWARTVPNMVCVVDLSTELPQAALSESERGRWWDDGIHLTPAGYDRMGEIIHPTVRTLLSKTR